jgi:hypothetical protein
VVKERAEERLSQIPDHHGAQSQYMPEFRCIGGDVPDCVSTGD